MQVSVVVATRDRPEYLSRCLEALGGQTLAKSDYEIIVVDDGSSPPVRLPAETAGRAAMKLVRRERAGGPAAARNEGIGVATGRVLAFTDDDCRPAADWLAAGSRAIESGLDIAAGRTIPEPAERATAGPFDYSMDVPGPDPRFSTCNCFYRADAVRAVGGFRDPFTSSSGDHLGEDTDLAWRAIERGARSGFSPDAVVYHAVRPRRFGEYLRSRRRLENLVPLVKRYPAVKQAHLSTRFYSWTHVFAYLSLAGLLGLIASPWAILLVLPYVVWRTREKRKLLTAPGEFLRRNRALGHYWIADCYECWVFASASIRHRHVFL